MIFYFLINKEKKKKKKCNDHVIYDGIKFCAYFLFFSTNFDIKNRLQNMMLMIWLSLKPIQSLENILSFFFSRFHSNTKITYNYNLCKFSDSAIP